MRKWFRNTIIYKLYRKRFDDRDAMKEIRTLYAKALVHRMADYEVKDLVLKTLDKALYDLSKDSDHRIPFLFRRDFVKILWNSDEVMVPIFDANLDQTYYEYGMQISKEIADVVMFGNYLNFVEYV